MLASLREPVRRALYEHVRAQGEPVDRDEAAAAIGIGRSLAAYHLDRLVELGLLCVSYARRTGKGGPGAGRPAKRYAPAESEVQLSLPPRDYGLAAGLLAEAVAADAGAAVDALEAGARRQGRELATGARRRDRRGRALARLLRDQGYEPRQEQDGTIVLGNCPFHMLAQRHPGVVCGMNLALCEGIVEGLGADGLAAALEPGSGRCCVIVRPLPPEPPGA